LAEGLIYSSSFPNFPANLGHAAGDAILHELGDLLHEHVREDNIACRYGGDEFIIVLPYSSRVVTSGRAELIREYAKQFHLHYK
jgi:diguanylate cyclase (GGDEF)-like protein